MSAFYVKNVPNGERVLRVLAGILAAGLALVEMTWPTGVVVAAGALAICATGLVGFCPACAMLGRKLKQGD